MNHRLPMFFPFVLFVAAVAIDLEASADEEKPVFRVVFFSPADVEPPDGVKERIKEYVDYSQMFFSKWMKHWGYECKGPLAVNRDEDGYPEVLYVKGRHTEASAVGVLADHEPGARAHVVIRVGERLVGPKGLIEVTQELPVMIPIKAPGVGDDIEL